jgi:hypothetical protein
MSDSALYAACRRYMPLVTRYDKTLHALGEWWQKVTLIGKINSRAVGATLIEDMQDTRRRFETLQDRLIANLVKENVRKLELEFSARAQVAIDILVRNLFERTADVGFLATDGDIRTFLGEAESSPESVRAIVGRLREYTAKYSVYDEIVLLDPQGRVRAHLDADNPIEHCRDPLILETLSSRAAYVETFRPSDLQPRRRAAHVFSAPVTSGDGSGARVLGVLCLCFRFDDEMRSVFANLARPGETLAILDAEGQVLASSDPEVLPTQFRVHGQGREDLGLMQHRGEQYVARTQTTRGYQGYRGLDWQGHVMRRVTSAFAGSGEDEPAAGEGGLQAAEAFSDELRGISHDAVRVTDDLTLVVLNGQIVSAKRDAAEFGPVLEEIRDIGRRTSGVFEASISDLYSTVVASLLSEVQFQAFQAVDIMDRNLYERANDVRWWALTSSFCEILAQPERSAADDAALGDVLAYINSLYTVYSNLFVFDTRGTIVAVSDARQREWLGQTVPDESIVRTALAVHESQRYAVSPFVATPFYDERNTYIYLTSIRAPGAAGRVVGGIGIVFDSAPQFAAMLDDTLPRDDDGAVLKGAFGVFVDRGRRIIASSRADLDVGSTLRLEADLFTLKNGARTSALLVYDGARYAVGAAVSQGYREYKTTGDYQNDILALVFVPL